LLATVATAALVVASLRRPAGTCELTSAPTIEQVQELTQLVTLEIPVRDVQTTKLQGYTGGVSLVLVVVGEVEVAIDLSRAHLCDPQPDAKHITLILPNPELRRPRLDHDRTRVYRVDRSGLWYLLPGDAGEAELVNYGMERAQATLLAAATRLGALNQARRHAEQVLTHFFDSRGEHVAIHWTDEPP
jgi:hypothetical protein